MPKIHRPGGWFYYIANSKPINYNKRGMGGGSAKTINVDSTFIKETRVAIS